MKFSLAAALLGCLSAVSALPLPQSPQQLSSVSALPFPQTPQQPLDDVAILQFALSLENLEANFYFQGLNQFSEADFRRENIPNPTQAFQHLHHILQHEAQHVKTLQAVITSLGGTPVPPCEYQFPFQTVQQFMDVANSLEKVGVSAYNGAVALLQNGDLQTAAATIDTVEGRHASFLQTANGGDPFPENFDVALDGRQIITLASPFIKQCSFDLGFVPFGTLQIKNQIHLPESDVECAFQQVSAGGQNFCNWLFADQSVVVPLNGNRCKAPPGARGDVYLMITNDQTPVSLKKTGSIVAGPAIVTIDTAHTDSCKELFSGKQLKEGQLNQPIDKGPIPMHDPTFNNAGALPLLPPAAAFPPPAYDAVPGVPPSNFDAILSPASSVPPSAYDAVPGVPPSNFDAILSPTSSVPPPAYDAVPGVPPSSFDAIPPSASSVPPPAYDAAPDVPPPPPAANDVPIEVRLEDPAIASMLAEIQALTQPQPIPPSELPVDPSIPPTNIESGQLPGGEPVYGEVPPPTETAVPPPADPSAVPPEDDPSAIPPEDDPTAIPPEDDPSDIPPEDDPSDIPDDVEANLSATETPPTEDEPVISFENNLTADSGPEPATDEEFPVFNS